MSRKRRSRGSGTISKAANGMFYFWWSDANGKRHKKSLRTRNKAEAQKQAEDLQRGVAAKDKADVLHEAAKAKKLMQQKDLPLGDVWTAFMQTNPSASQGTLGNYKRHLNEFIEWLQSNYPVITSFTDVSGDIAAEYCQHLWESGISANTYHYKKNSLGHITKALANKYGIAENKWHDPSLRKTETKQKRLPLSCQQVTALLQKLDEPHVDLPCPNECRIVVKMCLYAGTRLIDAVTMCWHNIDLNRGALTYTPRKTGSKGKEAEVPLLQPLYNEIITLESMAGNDQDYLFPGLVEQYERNADAIHKRIVTLVQQVAGDGKKHNETHGQRKVQRSAYGAHSLRATFATQAAMAGCKSVWLARMLGDSIQTTDQYYIRAGLGDTLITGFDQLPKLTSGPGESPQTKDPERERLHELVDSLPIGEVRDMLKHAQDQNT